MIQCIRKTCLFYVEWIADDTVRQLTQMHTDTHRDTMYVAQTHTHAHPVASHTRWTSLLLVCATWIDKACAINFGTRTAYTNRQKQQQHQQQHQRRQLIGEEKKMYYSAFRTAFSCIQIVRICVCA